MLRTVTSLRALTLLAALALTAAACGSGSTATHRLARAPDCKHVSRESPVRSMYCGSLPRTRSLTHERPANHPVRLPHVQCKTKIEEYFYAATDWLTLTKSLAHHASPCAQYYISIPPIQDAPGAWVLSRPKEPRIIHSFGPSFHAMAEVNTWPWGEWVDRTGRSWYDAGVLARRRMDGAGYSAKLGDIWAVNEFPLNLGTDLSEQKAMTEFVHGLYRGTNKDAPLKGLVWKVADFQTASDLAGWRKGLESWFSERRFWTAMSRYVRSWSSEVYADPVASCPPGSPFSRVARSVMAYLEHIPRLVDAGPGKAATARAFLERTYTPLANAAWQWNYGFGLTTIPAGQMQRFVALQTYGVAQFARTHPQAATPVRIGFGWAPKNTLGIEEGHFHDGNHRIADALARSISAAFTPNGIFPSRACGVGGRRCQCKVHGASLRQGWDTFVRPWR
jgi:hypothetical protein